MKDVIRNIVAITLTLTLLVSFVGVDIYKHFCNQTGDEFITVYVERSCKADDENTFCCINKINSKDVKEINSNSEPQAQSTEIIKDKKCYSRSSEYISLTENFVISKVSIPYFDSSLTITIKFNPAKLPEIDCYKEYINNIWYRINQPIKLIIRFIQALSQAGNPVSHKA